MSKRSCTDAYTETFPDGSIRSVTCGGQEVNAGGA